MKGRNGGKGEGNVSSSAHGRSAKPTHKKNDTNKQRDNGKRLGSAAWVVYLALAIAGIAVGIAVITQRPSAKTWEEGTTKTQQERQHAQHGDAVGVGRRIKPEADGAGVASPGNAHEAREGGFREPLLVDVSNHPRRYAQLVAAKEYPVRLKGSAINHWRARHWSIVGLDARFPIIKGWYTHDDPTFGPYFDPTRLLAAVASPTSGYQRDQAMSPGSALSPAGGAGPFKYLSIETAKLDPQLEDELEPLQEAISLFPSRSSINLWLGQAGVRAHCHYDGYHNFYLQIEGHKTFYLFEPRAVANLGTYPFLHPQHAQARANLTDPAQFEAVAAQHRPVVVTLDPGDVLYLPPLWWHYVVAETASLSVNVWTETKQTKAAEDMTSAAVAVIRSVISGLTAAEAPPALITHPQLQMVQRLTLVLATTAAVHARCGLAASGAQATPSASSTRLAALVRTCVGYKRAGSEAGVASQRPVETEAVTSAAACLEATLMHRYSDEVLGTLRRTLTTAARRRAQHIRRIWPNLLAYTAAILKAAPTTDVNAAAQQVCGVYALLPTSTQPLWAGNWMETVVATTAALSSSSSSSSSSSQQLEDILTGLLSFIVS